MEKIDILASNPFFKFHQATQGRFLKAFLDYQNRMDPIPTLCLLVPEAILMFLFPKKYTGLVFHGGVFETDIRIEYTARWCPLSK